MTRNRTYPKENQKKLNETIRELRSALRKKEKETKFLHDELNNIMKPVRDRKTHVEKDKLEYDEWRKDFITRWKRDTQGPEE